MIRSMTGYGSGESRLGGRVVNVRVRSVNSRFLELGLKLPPELWEREAEARDLAQARLKRGKVDVHVDEGGADPAAAARVDAACATAWRGTLTALARDLGLPFELGLESYLRLPGVLGPAGAAPDPEAASQRWTRLREALDLALGALEASRVREGRVLAQELGRLLEDAEARLAEVERLSLALQEGLAERMRRRLAQVLETLAPDDPRLTLEAALAADRADVREEVVRFRAHTAEFRRLLDGDAPVGKRLDFLCQELLREANTLGSKSPDAALTQAVVGLKSVVERLKEQAQNVE